MTLARLRDLCRSFPGATEQIQWGADLVFKVGGRMFCVACTEVAPVVTSFKCDEETFAELCERDGIVPAPYLARARWVALERWSALGDREYADLIGRSYHLIREKLPKKAQLALDGASRPGPRRSRRPGGRARKARHPEKLP
jgi:predicted DNA-binding protein (MmcQ/YjbR family)